MVDKVKSLNWALYSKFILIFANLAVVFCIANIAFNTKRLENSTIVAYYILIGIVTFVLIKFNNAALREIQD